MLPIVVPELITTLTVALPHPDGGIRMGILHIQADRFTHFAQLPTRSQYPELIRLWDGEILSTGVHAHRIAGSKVQGINAILWKGETLHGARSIRGWFNGWELLEEVGSDLLHEPVE